MISPRAPAARGVLAAFPAWLALAYAVRALLHVHLFLMSPPLLVHHLDEAYVNAFAWRMNTGRMLPFVDAVSHRGPLMYWAAALAQRLGSPTSWVPLRVLAMTCGVATVVLAFAACWIARRPLAGGVAALTIAAAILVGMWPLDGLAYSGEQLSNVFMMGALLALAAGLASPSRRPRPRSGLVFAAGALAMLNALSKQLGVVAVVTLGVWVLMTSLGRPGLARRERARLVAAYAGGALLPVALLVARYAAAGELSTLVYYTIDYNRGVYLAPFAGARLDRLLGWIDEHGAFFALFGPLAVWAFVRPIARAPRLRDVPRVFDEDGFAATVGLSALGLAITCNAALRGFPHYYLQAVPCVCIALGVTVEGALGARRSSGRDAAVQLLLYAPIVALLAVTVPRRIQLYTSDRDNQRAFVDGRASQLCAFVRAHSGPGDALFIWGFDPKYYTTCERRPASRFVFTTFVAGYVPWFDAATKVEDEARAVPGSREQLVEDLEATRPPIILDMPRSMGRRSMRRYGALAAYLGAGYCSAGTLPGSDDVEALLRRNADGACPAGSH